MFVSFVGLTIGGKTLREHCEIHCHNKALDFIIKSEQANNQTLSLDFICRVHRLCMPPAFEVWFMFIL